MNVRAAKVGVWFYMLFTLASFVTTVIFYITTTGMGSIFWVLVIMVPPFFR